MSKSINKDGWKSWRDKVPQRKEPVPIDGSEMTCDEAGVERCDDYPDCPCSAHPTPADKP